MARRLSAGKSTGNTSRKTSRRLLGGIAMGGGASATPVSGSRIEMPALRPQAEALNMYQQTNVPNAPGEIAIPTPPPLPEPTSIQDAKNLQGWLRDLQGNFFGAFDEVAKWDAARIKAAKQEAESIAGQYPPGKGPDDDLANIGSQMDKILANPKDKNDKPIYSIEEREGAKKIKSRLSGTGTQDDRVQRYLKSNLKKLDVQNRAFSLSSLAQGVEFDDVDTDGNPIKVPLASLSSSDPRYQQWASSTIYGNTFLNPKEYESLKPIIVNSLAQDAKRQDKVKLDYDYKQLKLDRNLTIRTIGKNLSTQQGAYSSDATIGLQALLDRQRKIAPHLTVQQQQELAQAIPELIVKAYLENNKTGDLSVVEGVLNGLMIGPEDTRYITKTIDGNDITVVNEKQRWINLRGGNVWLQERMAEARYELKETDNKNENTDIFYGKEDVDKQFAEAGGVTELLLKGDVKGATELLTKLKIDYREAALAKDPNSSDVVNEVLKYYDTAFIALQKTDSFTIQSDMLAISKLTLAATQDVPTAALMDRKLNELAEKYPGRPEVMKFINETRPKVATYLNKAAKPYLDTLNSTIKNIEGQWNQYASTSGSYDGQDVVHERNMFGAANAKAQEIGTEIIMRNLENRTPERIAGELNNALTRVNLGLIKKEEKDWTPDSPTSFPGDINTSLSSIEKLYDFKPGGLNRNDRQALTRSVKGFTPIFDAQTLMEMATKARKGEMDHRLWRILEETGMKPGDFFVQQIDKFKGHIKLSQQNRQDLLRLNGIRFRKGATIK